MYDTIKLAWFTIYIKVPTKIEFLSLKITTRVDPNEMQHYAAFHQGLHCLPKYLLRGFHNTKGL